MDKTGDLCNLINVRGDGISELVIKHQTLHFYVRTVVGCKRTDVGNVTDRFLFLYKSFLFKRKLAENDENHLISPKKL